MSNDFVCEPDADVGAFGEHATSTESPPSASGPPTPPWWLTPASEYRDPIAVDPTIYGIDSSDVGVTAARLPITSISSRRSRRSTVTSIQLARARIKPPRCSRRPQAVLRSQRAPPTLASGWRNRPTLAQLRKFLTRHRAEM